MSDAAWTATAPDQSVKAAIAASRADGLSTAPVTASEASRNVKMAADTEGEGLMRSVSDAEETKHPAGGCRPDVIYVTL